MSTRTLHSACAVLGCAVAIVSSPAPADAQATGGNDRPVAGAQATGAQAAGDDERARPQDEAPRADTLGVYEIESITVRRARAGRASAVPYGELNREELDLVSYAQDVPMVLASMPSTYAYSDAGNGFGYSYLRIRGFDQNRIGMMVNGVPLNDPESHQVYWVDHGDVLAGASSVQVQRGVGTTLFGQNAFGGTVDVETSPLAVQPGVHLETGFSTFTDGEIEKPTRNYRAAFATGPVLDGKVALYARYSRVDGEGYREQSALDQESFGLSALYDGETMSHKIDVLAGRELTHFSWDGVSPDAPVDTGALESQPCYEVDLDDRDERRCNRYAIYSNNVDDFKQVVGSVTSQRPLGEDAVLSNTLYYVDGEGFFEQYELDEDFFDYGLDPIVVNDSTTVESTDLVRRRWLDNRYFGVLPQLELPAGDGRAMIGAGLRYYTSDHYGELVWTDVDVDAPPLDRYYHNDTEKLTFEAYGRIEHPIGSRTRATLALQYQGHRYDYVQRPIGNFPGYAFEADHDFVSPRAGLHHELSSLVSAYGSVGFAQREPSVHDYIDEDDPSSVPAFADAGERTTGLDDPIPEAEKVLNAEFGVELKRRDWSVRAGVYQLEIRDELIPIDGGRILEEGQLRRANANKTRHQGLELEASMTPVSGLTLQGNVSFARHRFVDHEISAYWLDDYAGGLLRFDDNTIPRSPEILGNLLVRWEADENSVPGLMLGAELQHVGKQYIDAENTEAAAIDPFTLVNLTGRYDVGAALGSSRTFAVKVRVNNVFDTLYETFGYSYYDDFPARQLRFYWPGATRSVRVGIETVL